MSDEKVVEAVGNCRMNLARALHLFSRGQDLESGLVDPPTIKCGIARVRVQKIRDGVVYEDRVVEYGVNR